MQESPTILFDGVCNYCNSWVNFIIRNEKKGILKFAPLQSAAGKKLLSQYNVLTDANSVLFIEEGRIYSHSDAALRIIRYLSWPAKMFYVFKIVPRFIRDAVYNWIARNRYKWFGRTDACMIPDAKLRSRFLD
jgi:predicted DCC family thiol-disulfide oxidoreductase YuxK